MTGPSEGLKWTEVIARAVATVVCAWALFLVTGWSPVLCGVLSTAFCVGTMLTSARRRADVVRWAHSELETPWLCRDPHCLTCCTCTECGRARAHALRVCGVAITLRGPRPKHGGWSR